MHTFFINTSKQIDTIRHEQLFDSLVSQDKIKVYNYSLHQLNACAEKISETITRNDDMTEVYNIIVYVEICERNERALATERVVSLHIEEVLFARLYALGRKPNQALILFGENFVRDAEYGRGNEYRKNIRAALWEMFPLPKIEKARDIFKSVRGTFPEISRDNLHEYKVAAWSSLTKDVSADCLLQSDHECVVAILYEMAESIQNKDLQSVDLLDELYNALTNQKENVQRQVTSEKVQYAHVRTSLSDINERSRTEYKILLFVYLCALQGTIQLCDSMPKSSKGVENDSMMGACTIPKIDWASISTLFKEKKSIFERELDQIELAHEDFPQFNATLLQEKSIIPLSSALPKLFTEVKANKGFTVDKLKQSVNRTMEEIEEKNSENEKTIVKFITKITDAFSASKDAKMKAVAYKLSEEHVQNIQLTEDFLRSEMDRADSRIAEHRRLSMVATHVDELLKEAKIRIDYCFDCLKKGFLIYLIGVIFTLLFAIPHVVMQRSIFDAVYGWAFVAISLGAIILSYTTGYLIFRRIYKSRIIKELGIVCDKFAITQKEKQLCLEDYAALIQKDIPLSFCLNLYYSEFEEYVVRQNSISEFVTYHTKVLRKYIEYITNTLNELDVANAGQEPEPMDTYVSAIAIERDKYQNNMVYSLLDERNIDDCFAMRDEGEELL